MIAPGSTIGILGGGQLGRMLAMAAAEMGYHTHIYCPDTGAPAFEVSTHKTVAAYDDQAALNTFAKSVDVVTYEFENIPAAPVIELAKHVSVWPQPDILAVSQHRVLEKQALNKLGIATAKFAPVSSDAEFKAAVEKLGTPSVLKTALMGYDGKGQWMLREADDVEKAWALLSPSPLEGEGRGGGVS